MVTAETVATCRCSHCEVTVILAPGDEVRCPVCMRASTLVVIDEGNEQDNTSKRKLIAYAITIFALAALMSFLWGKALSSSEHVATHEMERCSDEIACDANRGLYCAVQGACLCRAGTTWSATEQACSAELSSSTLQIRGKYGAHHEAITTLRAKLVEEPCDTQVTYDLIEALEESRNSREAGTTADKFLESCGDVREIRLLARHAYERLRDWPNAIRHATARVRADSHNAATYGSRGLIYERSGDLESAALDFRQVMALRPENNRYPLNLADILEKQGDHCAALQVLEHLSHFHPKVRQQPSVRSRFAAVTGPGKCERVEPKGRAVLKRRPGDTAIALDVEVNGRATGRFILDTGATYVAVSASFAERAMLRRGGESFFARTANGVVEASLTTADSITVKALSASNVSVAIIDDLGEHDGLLGLSFLSRFDVKLEGGQKVILKSREY